MENQDKKPVSTLALLTREEQRTVIRWFVELRTNPEIVGLIKSEFDKDISRVGVWRYRNSKKWKPLIKRLRKRFEENMLKIPIANKVDRLRILYKVVQEGLTWNKKGTDKFGDPIYELKIGAVTQALKEARVEMEGHEPLIKIENHTHLTTINVKSLKGKPQRQIVDLVLNR